MGKQAEDIVNFLDSVSNEKLENWQTKEHYIVKNAKIGFRLDHQGVSGLKSSLKNASIDLHVDEQRW